MSGFYLTYVVTTISMASQSYPVEYCVMSLNDILRLFLKVTSPFLPQPEVFPN